MEDITNRTQQTVPVLLTAAEINIFFQMAFDLETGIVIGMFCFGFFLFIAWFMCRAYGRCYYPDDTEERKKIFSSLCPLTIIVCVNLLFKQAPRVLWL